MPVETFPDNVSAQRILGRIASVDFIGRDALLRRLTDLSREGALRDVQAQTARDESARAPLLLAAPLAGASELLRQAFDTLFARCSAAASSPVYFAFSRADRTAAAAATRFLYTFLQQIIAHRRADAAFVSASPLWADFVALAPPECAEWVRSLVEAHDRAAAFGDVRALVRVCFGAPRVAAAHGARTIVLFDDAHLIETLAGIEDARAEFAQMLGGAAGACVFSGLRRSLHDALYFASDRAADAPFDELHLESLDVGEARTLLARAAQLQGVALNDETRDLIVQQCGGLPWLLNVLIQAAARRGVALTSFLAFQRLYVDELFGGALNRRFQTMLEDATDDAAARRALLRLLYEALAVAGGRTSVESWQRRAGLNADELARALRSLNADELIGVAPASAPTIVENGTNAVWNDCIRIGYRLHVEASPRALVLAETLTEVLKRAPQQMARYYRRAAALDLRELLARFDNQKIPASLLHFERFERTYRGQDESAIYAALDAETELVRLPQIVHVASAAAFRQTAGEFFDDERAVVAHGFDATVYSTESEVTWLAAELDGKTPAGRALVEITLERLRALAQVCNFKRAHYLLAAAEGFTSDAQSMLEARDVFSMSRKQAELLTARLEGASPASSERATPDEFEMTIPMSEDSELIAAQAVEQLARRMSFSTSAINQIKTAIVEACINAAEHSLSPERKIYQRFRAENDKLVVTIASRGLALDPEKAESESQGLRQATTDGAGRDPRERRGWGLQLIRTLMDEVEFERVDDGTRLRMTKYLRRPERSS